MRRLFALLALALAATACGDGVCDPTGALHRYDCTPLEHPIPNHENIVCKEDVPGFTR